MTIIRFAQVLSVLLLLSLAVVLPGDVFADARQWGEDGVYIRQGHHIEWQRAGYRDANGYTLLTWSDTRTGDRDVYGQLIAPNGSQVWETTGVPLAQFREFRQEDPEPVSVTGGWIVAWAEFREDSSGDIWAQKFDANGAPQWPANNFTGVRVDANSAVFLETTIRAVHDGNGGAIIAWIDDRRDQADIIAQHVDASGVVTCSPPLMVTDADNGQLDISADSDGNGNMLVTWSDGRSDPVAPNIYAAKITPACVREWEVVVCDALGEQTAPKLCPDGAGGCNIAWVDKRNGEEDLYAQRMNGSGQPQWTPNGVSVCVAPFNQNGVRVATSINSGSPDGVVMVWEDFRVNNAIGEIYCQKLDGAGTEQWQDEGFRVCGDASTDSLNQGFPRQGGRLSSDFAGGLACAWEDMRNGDHLTATSDIYAARVLVNGTHACGECGVSVVDTVGQQFGPLIRVDEGDGFFVFWSDKRTGSQSLRYQNLNFSNCSQTLNPEGVEIVYGLDGNATRPRSVPMAMGRVGVVWTDNRYGPGGLALYYQVIDSTGHIDTVQNGVPVAPNNTDGSLFSQDLHEACPDGNNGFFVSWVDNRSGTKRIRLSHVNNQSEIVFGDSGAVVWEATRDQTVAFVAPDGQGGVYVAWSGYSPAFWLDVYVMRMSADLQRLWSNPARLSNSQPDDVLRGIVSNPDGCCIVAWHSGPFEDVNVSAARVCAAGDTSWIMDVCDNLTNQDNAAIVADGIGGAYLAWADSRDFDTALLDIYAQHVPSSGVVSWADNGILVVTANENQNQPSLAVDENRNLFVVWQDFRSGDNTDIYAQKITPAGALQWPQTGKPLCIAVGQQVQQQEQEHGVEAEWDNGLYAVWTDGRGYHSDIYGTHVNESGQIVQTADPNYWIPDSGSVIIDFFHIQDQPTAADDGHGGIITAWQDYRASGKEPMINIWANWINDYTVGVREIPNAAMPKEHELAQNYPNPFNPVTQIRFSLPQRERVEILLFNMLGQRTATLVNEVMNAGAYVIDFEAQSLPSGTYFYRMETPTFRTVRKMVLLR